MGADVIPAWDTFFLAVPILVIFAVWILGLDERLMSPRRPSKRSRRFCEVSADGRGMLSDPDGRLWRAGPNLQGSSRQIEARMVRRDGSGQIDTWLSSSRC